LPVTDNRSGSGLQIGCRCCHMAKCCPSETRGNRCVSDCREIFWDVSANQPGGASTFSSDETINGCSVEIDSHYLGFIREYLAELTPNMNVFDTLPIWQSGANFLKLMPLAVMNSHSKQLIHSRHHELISIKNQDELNLNLNFQSLSHYLTQTRMQAKSLLT
jgi:hypothetical protein